MNRLKILADLGEGICQRSGRKHGQFSRLQ